MISSILHGATALNGEFTRVTKGVDRVTIAATRAVQRKIVSSIRRELNGAPRWNHRGRSSIHPEPVTLAGQPRHSPRGGPPGKFTGELRRGAGGKRRLVAIGGHVTGGAGIGTAGGKFPANNIKKGRLEDKYPFFDAAVRRVEPELAAIYDAAWAKALARRGGL